MTVDNAKALLVKAKENAPTKEQMDASIKTLQVINNIYEKSIQAHLMLALYTNKQ